METLERTSGSDLLLAAPFAQQAIVRTMAPEAEVLYEIISADWITQAEYVILRQNGLSHNLAEMVALAMPPGVTGTERAFLEGHCNGNQFQGGRMATAQGDYYKRVAEEAGQSTTGRVYLSGLAEYPGDPRAWVSGRDEAQTVIQERGFGSVGSIKAKAREPLNPHPPGPAVAPDILAAQVEAAVDKVPVKDRGDIHLPDLVDKTRQRLTPHWAKS